MYTHKFPYTTNTGRQPRIRICMCICMSCRLERAGKVTASYVRELLHVGFLGHARLISQGYIFRVSFPRANVVERRSHRRDTSGWYKPGIHHVIPWLRVGPAACATINHA